MATSGGSVSVFRISSANLASSGVYGNPPTRSRFAVHQTAQILVRQNVVDRAGHLEIHRRPGAERRAFGGVDDAIPDAVEDPHVRLARVVVDLGEIGHDVRRPPPRVMT